MKNQREIELEKIINELSNKLESKEKVIFSLKDELAATKEEMAKLQEKYEKKIAEINAKKEIIKKRNYNEFFSKSEETSKILKQAKTIEIKSKQKVGRKIGSKNYSTIDFLKPDETIILNPSEYDKAIDKGSFVKIGEDKSYKIIRTPATYKLRLLIRNKYKNIETNSIYQVLSDEVFGNSIISPSFVANALYLKYCLCLPISKLTKYINNEMGIKISKQSWSNYFLFASEKLTPIYEAISNELKNNEARIIQCDETTVALSKSKKNDANKKYVFVATSTYYTKQVAYYEFISKRVIANATLLQGFEGSIVVDGYAGYNYLVNSNIIIQRCLVHARRYVTDSIKSSVTKEDSPSIKLLKLINRLFVIEQKIKEEIAPIKVEKRNELELPIIKQIISICEIHKNSRIDSFAKACKYILKYEKELSSYLNNGYLPIHNNKSERVVNNFVQARKNFQTMCSEESAISNMRLFTIIQTARLNGLNEEDYLCYILKQLHNKVDPNSLLPWSEQLPKNLRLELDE